MKSLSCLNPECRSHEKVGSGNVVRHGFYRTRSAKRRRYRCLECKKTFSSTKGTPYYRLQHRRATFDAVVALRVEGVSISAVARVEGLAWNTVARWLERAAPVCRRFNHGRITGFVVEELQADEIRTFTGSKSRPTWVFVAIEVWSRLWPSTVTGNEATETLWRLFATLPTGWISSVFLDRHRRIRFLREGRPSRLWSRGSVRPGAQTRRNDRIVKVERRELMGASWRFETLGSAPEITRSCSR